MIEVFDCPQGSPEWHRAKMGVPSASEFEKVLMRGRKPGEASKTRRRYMMELIGERLTGEPRETYCGFHMDRGKAMEPEAVTAYALLYDADPEIVGFIRNGEVGCSPDRLIGADGMLQIKTMMPPLLLELNLSGDTSDHFIQQQGELWVAEREWSDLFIYWPRIKPFRKRVYRDEKAIKEIRLGTEIFLNEMQELMEKLEAA